MTTNHTPTPRAFFTDRKRERRIISLRNKVNRLEADLATARKNLAIEVEEAVGLGEPVTAVAAASGYSRQWVHSLTRNDS